MPQLPAPLRRTFAALLVAGAFAAPAVAQLDLPEKKERPAPAPQEREQETDAPRERPQDAPDAQGAQDTQDTDEVGTTRDDAAPPPLVCTVCRTENPSATRERPHPDGGFWARCDQRQCRRDRRHLAEVDVVGRSGGDPGPGEVGPGAGGGGGDLAPHLLCTVCNTRNYGAVRDQPHPSGGFTAWCSVCNRDRLQKVGVRGGSSRSKDGLDLPSAPPVRRRSAPPAQQREDRTAPAAPRSPAYENQATFIYQQIADTQQVSGSLVDQAVESLVNLGDQGIAASRVALQSDDASRVVLAARVLLRNGDARDSEAIVERLKGDVPVRAASLLLDQLVAHDPVHASPMLLVELLDHRLHPLRKAALKHVRARVESMDSAQILTLLERALHSRRTQTRMNTVEILATIDDPAVVPLLLARLSDSSARVTDQVVDALARRPGRDIELELLARAFNDRWILRENAYALLTLVEREDVKLEPILDETHVETLLHGLESRDVFVRGTCAAALAGIGFRSPDPTRSRWLDRDVTGRLIDVVTGREFHPDYSALQPRALRRLRLITGEDFGTNGPKWADWWIDSRDDFYARRAWLRITEDDVPRLEAHYRGSAGGETGVFSLIGPEAQERDARRRAGVGEVLLLTRAQCEDLAALLERERVLTPERLPGTRGSGLSTRTRTVEILVDGRGKRFTFAPDRTEPWFEKIASALVDLRRRNRWQRYPDLTAYEDARAFWEVESGWWSVDHSPVERAVRLKSLVLGAVRAMRPSHRSGAIEELKGVYRIEGARSPDDLPAFMELLRQEAFLAQRARDLVDLCLLSAQSREGGMDADTAQRLIDLLEARFEVRALDEMARVAEAAGTEYVHSLAGDPSPLLRAVAAHVLSKNPSDEDVALLMALLEDPEQSVEAAACLALGSAQVDAARTELLVRARVGDERVRCAALRAVGRLGGEYAREPLVLASADQDEDVRLAAAEGLADLADPQTASLLVSMLGRGRDSILYEPARRGLLRMGDAARGDLVRVMNSPQHRSHTEATLLLARQCDPAAMETLLALLTDAPDDPRLLFEAAVLSCVDLRQSKDPVASWSEWWEEVRHDDSLAWLLAAAERRDLDAPPRDALLGAGTREGALFLVELVDRPEDFLAERARRELSRMVGDELGVIPPGAEERAAWVEGLRAGVDEHWDS